MWYVICDIYRVGYDVIGIMCGINMLLVESVGKYVIVRKCGKYENVRKCGKICGCYKVWEIWDC